VDLETLRRLLPRAGCETAAPPPPTRVTVPAFTVRRVRASNGEPERRLERDRRRTCWFHPASTSYTVQSESHTLLYTKRYTPDSGANINRYCGFGPHIPRHCEEPPLAVTATAAAVRRPAAPDRQALLPRPATVPRRPAQPRAGGSRTKALRRRAIRCREGMRGQGRLAAWHSTCHLPRAHMPRRFRGSQRLAPVDRSRPLFRGRGGDHGGLR
jgi:hypothetical protein